MMKKYWPRDKVFLSDFNLMLSEGHMRTTKGGYQWNPPTEYLIMQLFMHN